MENNERVLTEKQQAVWDLKEQGMTKKRIAETLNISLNMVTTHLKNADRRFREYERHLAHEKRNNQIIPVQFTRGELELMVHALCEYEHVLMKQARFNVRTDWRGRLPYGAELTQQLSEKIQMNVYGSVMYKSILIDHKDEEEQE